MDNVITKDGLLKKEDYVIPPFEILSKIPEWVTFEENLTLRELLTFISNYPDLHYVQPELKELSEYVSVASTNTEDEPQRLEVYYTCGVSWRPTTVKDMVSVPDEETNGKFSKVEFTYDDVPSAHENSYHGVHIKYPEREEEQVFSITFTPISDMIDLPIVMGNIDYYVSIDKEYKQHSTPMNGCSLYDLMDAVLDSVMFFGSEERKADEFNNLKSIVDDLDLVDLDDGE